MRRKILSSGLAALATTAMFLGVAAPVQAQDAQKTQHRRHHG